MSAASRLAPRPRVVLIAVAVMLVLTVGSIGLGYARTTIPSPSVIAAQQTTRIYASDGKTLIATIGDTTRTDVTLSQVPAVVQHAVLAAEDRHFYSEPGVSPTGILRALAVDVKGGDVTQGGSTITQQYAKNAYLSSQRSFTRKIKEIFIATKLGQTRSKATVLTDYLNTIYFGRNAYGIQAAAKAYFGKPVGALDAAQGALLAAVIRGPSLYDPRVSPAAARSRWSYVVNGMVKQHWLTSSQAASLQFPSTVPYKGAASSCDQGWECFIRDAVELELRTRDHLTQDQLDLGGYKVVTTIDKDAEAGAVAAEQAVVAANRTGTPESGLAAVKPGDGAIEALYGGRQYCKPKKTDPQACIDLSGATGQWTRPGGSSFKTFTLLAALQKGISLQSTFDGPYQIDVNGSTIHNSSAGESCYGCTLTTAFARSINTIFVPLAQQVGPAKVVAAAHDAGIPSSVQIAPVPVVSLGVATVSPLQLADAYATIAAQGIHATPYLVRSVSTTTGRRVFTAHPQTERVFPAKVTADATYAMQRVLQTGGTAAGHALAGGRPAAGKTGTTDNNTNAWFTGFTPQLCTSVWIGNAKASQPLTTSGGEVFGGTLPAEVWQQTMDAALAGLPVVQFPPSSGIGSVQVSSSPTATSTGSRSASPSASSSASPSSSASASATSSASTSPSSSRTVSPPPSASATRSRQAHDPG